jgi:hypothetical protein
VSVFEGPYVEDGGIQKFKSVSLVPVYLVAVLQRVDRVLEGLALI